MHTPSTDTDAESESNAASALSRRTRRIGRQLLLGSILFSLIAVEPALAQASPICDASNLPGIIEGFFQITTAIGLMGLVIVWQADLITGIFTIDPDQRKGLKRHRRTAAKSAAIVTALGPLYMVAGSIMNLPLADCVNLAPW